MAASVQTVLNPHNAAFIADLYSRYLEDPNSVDPSWIDFFRDLHEDGRAILSELRGASWTPEPAISNESEDRDTQAAIGRQMAAEQIAHIRADGWAGVYLMSPASHAPIIDVLAEGLEVRPAETAS